MAQAMKYNVLTIKYVPTGTRDNQGNMIFEVQFQKIGKAHDMKHAKQKFGGFPVLEEA